jgi:flavin reductase (DIM6/NTAB) family NADH-FMN oxidoreductase RutF
MTIEKSFFRQVMGHFTTGVTVVTTRHHGELGGLTVNSFCSVSLDPPLVLICVDLSSQTLRLIRESKSYAVNILTDKQEHLSHCFSTHSHERLAHFCHASFHKAVTGAPIIDDALAFIDAHVVAEYAGGDHAIFLGQVVAIGIADQVRFPDDADSAYDPSPLIYYQAQYRQLADKQYENLSLATSHDKPSPQ